MPPPTSPSSRARPRPRETIEWEDGNTYPVISVDVSSASHPFYTGKQKIMDTAGRVERFTKRYGERPRRQG